MPAWFTSSKSPVASGGCRCPCTCSGAAGRPVDSFRRFLDRPGVGTHLGGHGSGHKPLDQRRVGQQHGPGSAANSTADSAVMTAEPRSVRTTTPSPPAACSNAAITRSRLVPIRPSSVPPAGMITTSGAIWAASSTAPSAIFSLWETTTSPTVTRPLRRRRAGSGRWRPRPGPGARCCARPGSWRAPCGPASDRWTRRPPPPLPRRRSSTLWTSPSDAAAAAAASTAGVQASTIVLSPGSAFPRATMPSRAACRAATRVAASISAWSPSAVAARRNAVP